MRAIAGTTSLQAAGSGRGLFFESIFADRLVRATLAGMLGLRRLHSQSCERLARSGKNSHGNVDNALLIENWAPVVGYDGRTRVDRACQGFIPQVAGPLHAEGAQP